MTLRPASLDELVSLIADSAAHSRALRLVGRGTWLDGGAPVVGSATPVLLDAFSGIMEYEPGDLTITLGAATTIAELDAVTAEHNQWCPLAPWGGNAGSVGATIATATPGPFSLALGAPRDLVLGLECVDGRGKVLRPGGKVVKNVAGFDLVRLMTGSWGSLAALTGVSLRLRARPVVDESWIVSLDGAAANGARELLRRGPTPPIACEILEGEAALAIGAGQNSGLLVRIAGNAAFVDAARAAVSALGRIHQADPGFWDRLRAVRKAPRRKTADDAARTLNARVKAAFDPANILNPGIME